MSKKKPMTLDALARLVAAGFEGVQRHVGELDNRVADVEEKVATKLELHDLEDRLTKEMRTVASQVAYQIVHAPDSTTERRFQGIEKRVGKLERQAR